MKRQGWWRRDVTERPPAEGSSAADPAAATPPPPPTRWERARPIAVPVLVAVAAKAATLLLAFEFLRHPDRYWHLLATAWDGEHYLHIARDGYQYRGSGDGDSIAFGMAYPLLIRLAGGSEAAALVIANACSLGAVALLAWHWGPRPALAVALFPSFLVFGTVAYSEGLYLLLAAAAFVAIERGRSAASSAAAGALGGLAAATRYMGGPALLLAALPWSKWRPARRWLAFALVSAAGLAIFLFQWAYTGHLLGYAWAQKPWGSRPAWPWEHFDWLLTGWFTLQGGPIAPWGNLSPVDFATRDLLFLVPVAAGIVLLFREPGRRAAAVYSAVAFAIALCTVGTPAVSLPRFLVAAFPAIAAVGDRMRSPLLWAGTIVAAVALAAHGLSHHLYGFWS
jgi:hypothetical protein